MTTSVNFLNFIAASSCSKPSIQSTSFTTQDATIVTNIAYIAQFKLSCDGEPAVSVLNQLCLFSIFYQLHVQQDIPLYAEVGGKPLSVVKNKDVGEYIVSWLEDTKKAPRGNFEIKVYDDEGYAAVRKASFIPNLIL